MHCPACNEPLDLSPAVRGVDRLHGTAGTFDVVRCTGCGSGVTVPPPAAEDLGSYYPAEYGPYDQPTGLAAVVSRLIRSYQVRRAVMRIPLSALRDSPPGRLVDVGCGRGDLAASFARRGWHAVGIEPSAGACSVAREQGVDARQGTLDDVPLERDAYDVAIFQHSLEHTLDPAGDLGRIRAAVRPGGFALITVPNFGSWQRRRFRDRWYHLDLPRHRTHFTGTGLRRLLERAGFDVESVTTSTSTVGLPATLQYKIAGRCLFPRGLGLRVASGLCVLVLPLARALDRLAGGGDQLHAVARRR